MRDCSIYPEKVKVCEELEAVCRAGASGSALQFSPPGECWKISVIEVKKKRSLTVGVAVA